ncbi:chromosomal replication initiator protein DnaA [Candidatus Gottesmanbacteria bacterium]|nr:chromosomal replication initiator protein DnaA [Candidatus Gottesmanbacteria bacterium]
MDLTRLWKSVLAEIELSVSKATYHTHFAHSELVALNGDVASIGFPSPIMRTLAETRYYSLIKSTLDHKTNGNTSLVFTVLPKKEQEGADAGPLFMQPVEAETSALMQAKRLHINPELTFDNYAVSTTNQLAYAAATAVAKTLGGAYNPLFLYGGVGVGKTHLMYAIANSILMVRPTLKVVYCMGEEFLNEIIEAIQSKTARQFKQKYRGAQLLMVDDVQFIAGKQTAQEEFFHTFNAVLREGGQVLLTSDRPPHEISRLEDRLRSRFEGGLIVDISPPDFELRAAIVNIKSKALGINVPSDAAQLIAANVVDTRAIEGFLRRLATELSARPQPVSPDLVSSLLNTKSLVNLQTKPTKRVSSQELLDAVSAYFEIKTTVLKGTKRDRPIARPRQVYMYLAKTELGLTYDDIGGSLGGRDHTTIMHGVETITQELSTNEPLRAAVAGIKQKLWATSS